VFCFLAVTGSEYESMVDQICLMGFEREQVNHTSPVHMASYYMAVSHKDWELPNSRIDWLKSILTAV